MFYKCIILPCWLQNLFPSSTPRKTPIWGLRKFTRCRSLRLHLWADWVSSLISKPPPIYGRPSPRNTILVLAVELWNLAQKFSRMMISSKLLCTCLRHHVTSLKFNIIGGVARIQRKYTRAQVGRLRLGDVQWKDGWFDCRKANLLAATIERFFPTCDAKNQSFHHKLHGWHSPRHIINTKYQPLRTHKDHAKEKPCCCQNIHVH